MDNEHLTARQVMKILDVTLFHVYYLVKNNKLKFHSRVGRSNKYIFLRQEVERFQRERRRPGRPPRAEAVNE